MKIVLEEVERRVEHHCPIEGVLPMSSFALLLLARCTARTTSRSIDVQLVVTSRPIAGVSSDIADQSVSISKEEDEMSLSFK